MSAESVPETSQKLHILQRHRHTLKMSTESVPETSQNLHILQRHRHTLKMSTESVPETSENLHILTRHSARQNVTQPSVYRVHIQQTHPATFPCPLAPHCSCPRHKTHVFTILKRVRRPMRNERKFTNLCSAYLPSFLRTRASTESGTVALGTVAQWHWAQQTAGKIMFI